MGFRMNISRKRKGKKKTTCWRTILVQSRSGCGGGSSPSAAFIFPPTTNRTVAAIYKEGHDKCNTKHAFMSELKGQVP